MRPRARRVVLTDRAPHVLSHQPAPLGAALGEVLRRDGIELVLGAGVTGARREDGGDGDYVLSLDDGRQLRGDKLLVATGRRPRVHDIGLETVGVRADEHGIPVDASLRAAQNIWVVGDATGRWMLTHVGKYQGEVVADNILGTPRQVDYRAVPGVVYTDPQAASVGAQDAPFSASVPLSEVAKTATYTRAYAEDNGFLTLLSDGRSRRSQRCTSPRSRPCATGSPPGSGSAGPPGRSAPGRSAPSCARRRRSGRQRRIWRSSSSC